MSNAAASQPRRGEFTGSIVHQSPRGPHHWSVVLGFEGDAAGALAAATPGQFVQAACREMDDPRLTAPLLRRPFSISGLSAEPAFATASSEINPSAKKVYVRLIYRTLGPGTQWLAHRREGETVNVLGPLGKGFTLPEDKNRPVLLLGGGVGLPPMFFLADRLRLRGHKRVLAVAGAVTADMLVGQLAVAAEVVAEDEPGPWLTEFAASDTPCLLTTDDGSVGYEGTAIAAAEPYLSANSDWQGACIYACGPQAMLQAAATLAAQHSLPCQVCMESYMACGIGVCQSCVVAIKTKAPQRKYRLACAHGPVFDAAEVAWDADE